MTTASLKIVFHGQNAGGFRPGFDERVDTSHTIVSVSDDLSAPGEVAHYQSADVIVGIRLDASLPKPDRLRLFHAPAAGTDAIDRTLLPPGSVLCNCHGHEVAIAEYVFCALLSRHVPLVRADADLRQGHWTYWAGRPGALRTELSDQTIGLLGFGHISQAIAARAKAFGMTVHAANRSPINSMHVDAAYSLDQVDAFYRAVDIVVVTLPLTPQTQGLVGQTAFEAMQPHTVVMNVGRGPVIDEAALYQALKTRRIGAAVIDTWYQYPTGDSPQRQASSLDFAALDNVVMTPHMSGWTNGTIRRRQQTIADNVTRLATGQPLANVL